MVRKFLRKLIAYSRKNMTDHIRPEMTLPFNRTALWYSSVTKITPVFVILFSIMNNELPVCFFLTLSVLRPRNWPRILLLTQTT